MQITDVRIRRIPAYSGEAKLKATASIVIDDCFAVHELRVVEGTRGLFVAMPRRKSAEGEYKDIAHPITAEAREAIQRAVLLAYHEAETREA